ncbi:MAG: UDP-3-O-acyl-N-acetylglucosamine deacetylase [Limibacillus sp.]|jgi:UDP-3-O-[3-hydroxymyristoyl] N-acetylglucosamine deacetylase
MSTLSQHTLKNPIHCSGIGVHSGLRVSMTLNPAEADSGIVFRRTDVEGVELQAHWKNAVETPLCTTLVAENGQKVSTIEHLMSAFVACGIDNALVEISAEEVPIMDGSAAPFVFLIECAGRARQDAPRRAIRILKDVSVEEPHRAASFVPGEGFTVDFDIDFDNDLVSRQSWSGAITEETFKSEISRARTFGFLHEVEQLRKMGLARGGSLDNAVVIDGDKVMNEGGLRFKDEFVRHKVLDSIGDLYLAGAPILGHFTGHKAGHALNLRLLVELFSDQDAWEWVEMTEDDLEPGIIAAAGNALPSIRAAAASV